MTVEKYKETYEVTSPARLVVKNIRGTVNLVPGEEGVIKVKAEKVLNNGSDDDLILEIYKEGSTVYAVARQQESFRIFSKSWPCKVHFEIEAPPETSINVKTVSAAVEAKGFSGDIKINTVSGSQSITDLNGLLDLESVSGTIVGQNLTGKADVSTVSGYIQVTQSNLKALRAKTVGGKIEAQTLLEEGPYDFSSVSGAVRLATPKGTNCDVFATGIGGQFETDLEVRSAVSGGRSYQVKVGDGGPQVRIKTVSGRMSLVS